MVSSAETAAEPESAGTSAQQDEDASQDPGNVLILIKSLWFLPEFVRVYYIIIEHSSVLTQLSVFCSPEFLSWC